METINKNKKFIVDIKQHGEGCDYTIGCGQKTFIIYAEDLLQANKRFIEMFYPDFESNDVDWTDDYGGYTDEMNLENAIIYEVVDELKIDMPSIYKNIEKIRLSEAQKMIEDRERAEFERLKQKYE